MLNLSGEIGLTKNRLTCIRTAIMQGKVDHETIKDLDEAVSHLDLLVGDLQSAVMKTRMQPIEGVWSRLPRVVRDLGAQCGKQVKLVMEGRETELDKTMVERIADPLMHLVRNSLDHGIETPEERAAAGKPRVGNLLLAAGHEGNQIIISIKDDGKGIDTDRVGRKAVEKGLVTEEQLAAMSQREMFDLIFLPGFSTKEKASDLSGRGVGMDVVKTNIKKLNGLIEIRSERGQGSEFILRLPLTLAIIQSLLVEVEGEVYSIPLSSVLETLRVDQRQFHVIGGQEVLKLREMVLPLMRLQTIFNVQQKYERDDFCYVVVVGAADKRMGLVVTRLVGQQEVAIKSLGNYLANIPGIAGSTILGDGRVTLIVDPVGLIDGGESSSGR